MVIEGLLLVVSLRVLLVASNRKSRSSSLKIKRNFFFFDKPSSKVAFRWGLILKFTKDPASSLSPWTSRLSTLPQDWMAYDHRMASRMF